MVLCTFDTFANVSSLEAENPQNPNRKKKPDLIPALHQIRLQLVQHVRVVRSYNDHRRVADGLAESQYLLVWHPVRVDELLKLHTNTRNNKKKKKNGERSEHRHASFTPRKVTPYNIPRFVPSGQEFLLPLTQRSGRFAAAKPDIRYCYSAPSCLIKQTKDPRTDVPLGSGGKFNFAAGQSRGIELGA